MTSRARKVLHKQIKENFKSDVSFHLWDIFVAPFRPNKESELLEWGVIVYDMYETHTSCVYYSKDKQQALEFAEKLDRKLNQEQDIQLEEYFSKPVSLHCSNKLGSYYS
ncbi:hypothetical protein ACWIUA_11500 [Ursidibacter sp. B-7004-1]